MSEPRFVDGLSAFADRYEGFIIDQWGVLHDGAKPYPDALATLGELLRRNKRVVLLSNSGRRASLNRERLRAMGFNPAALTATVTSGEAAWQLMHERANPPWSGLGRRCFFLTHLDDHGIVEGLDLELVDSIEAAEFIFATGLDHYETPDAMRELAEAGIARGLPMVCSNPDIVAVSGTELVPAPGALAQVYAELGGTVHFVGKPHRPVYAACLRALEGLELAEIVAVGDSLEHDIKGARNVGIASAFVMGGIHAEHFAPQASRAAHVTALDELTARYDARPDWVLPQFAW